MDKVTLIFVELAVGLLMAAVLGSLARFFRQPLILAYIVTGLLISLIGVFRLGAADVLPLLANFGVVLLLFLIGLELRLTDLKYVGKSAFYTGLGQLIFTFFVGLAIIKGLGFSLVESVYISVALTFSSTIIVVKLLTEKKDLNSLYGKITIGFLLVQDLVAILVLIFLAGFEPTSQVNFFQFLIIAIKGTMVIFTAFLLAKFILPTTFRYTSTSTELLLITAIAWCFIFASFAKLIGFSLEIGAFIGGVAIATSPYHLEILSKIRPIRDFFIVIFFIFLGTNMAISEIGQMLVPTIILSAFVLVGNPLVVGVIMGFLGHTKRTSFLASVTVAQISEFSLIVAAMGVRLGHINSSVLSMIAAVGIITITVSSYIITHSNRIYQKLANLLDIFERKHVKESRLARPTTFSNHVVLVGCEQVGQNLLEFLEKKVESDKLVVVDFNPTIIDGLKVNGVNAIFGDIADFDLLEELNLKQAKLIISTVPDPQDNLALIKAAKDVGFGGPIIVTSYWKKDGIKLYEAGADFVLVPELVGGDKVIRILVDSWEDLDQLRGAKSKNLANLLEKV